MISTDNETFLTAPGQKAAKLVCVSFSDRVDRAEVVHARDPACRRMVINLLESRMPMVGFYIAYDMATWAAEWPDLLPLIFQAYDADRIHCVMLQQQLLDIARGSFRYLRTPLGTKKLKYNLQETAERHGYPVKLDKDTWRLRYGELYPFPIEQWPQEAVDYPGHDTKSTLWSKYSLDDEVRRDGRPLFDDAFRQARYSFALTLVATWGMRTDAVMVDRLRQITEFKLWKYGQELLQAGLLWIDKKGVLHKRKKQMEEYALKVNPGAPKTPTGHPSLDADALSHYGDDPIITAFQGYSSTDTVMARLDELKEGITLPIHTRFDLTDTGRVSSDHPNVMNRPVSLIGACFYCKEIPDDLSKGICPRCGAQLVLAGDRECFVPRQGNVFVDIDYDGLELRTWAQVCLWILGQSKLAQVLNAGGDPHAMIGAQLLGISLEEFLKRKKNKADKDVYNARQSGKVGNFGLPGGLGAETLRAQARVKYELVLDPVVREFRQVRDYKRGGTKLVPVYPETERIIEVWKNTWPESTMYARHVKELTRHGSTDIIHFLSNRYRGDVSYTEAGNSFFQGLGSDVAKSALYALVRECYIGNGILRGSRVVNFVHDQVIGEVPEEIAHEAAKEFQRIWIGEANKWLRDVPATADPVLCRRWSKLAGDEKTGTFTNGIWEWNEAIRAGSLGYAPIGRAA